MRKLFLFFLIFSFVIGCSDKNKLPDGVLSPKKMQEVMWDMVRAGEFMNSFVFSRDSNMNKAAESQKWYDKIYQIHKISKAQFDKSYAYYEEHPVLMKTLLDSLSKKQVSKGAYGQSSSPRDSLNKQGPFSADNARKKMLDTLNRRKILKKRINGQ